MRRNISDLLLGAAPVPVIACLTFRGSYSGDWEIALRAAAIATTRTPEPEHRLHILAEEGASRAISSGVYWSIGAVPVEITADADSGLPASERCITPRAITSGLRLGAIPTTP